MKKTALYDRHLVLNAKLVSFAGYQMPVQYSGIVNEHRAVRKTAGIFDVSHMGEFFVRGSAAEAFLNQVTINDVTLIKPGQAQYSAMCYEDGGIVDDLLIYRYNNYFMLVVNASNLEKDYTWLSDQLIDGVTIENRSAEISLIALQGPWSRDILRELTADAIDDIPFYHFIEGRIAGKSVTIARTGYTGELGFEIYAENEDIPIVWDNLMEAGAQYDLLPVGLGARDTLRLEMKYCLYGNDIDKNTNPIEAGLGWITKLTKNDFIGKSAIIAHKENLRRRLVCIEMQERAVPRPGYKLYNSAEEIGIITSGTHSPSLNIGIGLAYLKRGFTKSGTEIDVDIRGKLKKAIVVKPPFYKDGTIQN
ncbi:MAG: glycine cleavage system aminomethyltransferase GcvT [Candidatus Marinimicrobia bacterium]|nr:glycine cleavage system aminomethyltransferase GcvT [Candidatus Neomarinimicrobiota bacterium]